MTEKMTEAERSKIEEFVEAGHTLSEDQASALLVEVDRARASESALADALQELRTIARSSGQRGLHEAILNAGTALRRAGR